MKTDWSELNKHRIRSGALGSDDAAGCNGAFAFRCGRVDFIVIASSGMGWEHVSARARGFDLKERVPTWAEMCWIKNQFGEDDECVVQFHPPKADYVNVHPNVLHLWRPTDIEMPRPDKVMV